MNYNPTVIYATPTTGKSTLVDMLVKRGLSVYDTDDFITVASDNESKRKLFDDVFKLATEDASSGNQVVILTNLRYSNVLRQAHLVVVGMPGRLKYHANLHRTDLKELESQWDSWESSYLTIPSGRPNTGLPKGISLWAPTPGADKTDYTIVLDHDVYLSDIVYRMAPVVSLLLDATDNNKGTTNSISRGKHVKTK